VFVSRDAGVKFFRFNAGLAAILLIIALVAYSASIRAMVAQAYQAGAGAVSLDPVLTWSVLSLIVATAAVLLYWMTVGRVLARIRPAIVGVAVGAGAIALLLQAVSFGGAVPTVLQALGVASVATSAALLGTTCTAMILGHWYLVIPSMQVSHLQSIVKLHIAALAARIAVVVVVVWYAIAVSFSPQPGLVPTFRHYVTSIDGIFFWQRVLFGLAGPAVLSYLTWETAKIRSTQSATGILYVDFFTVVVGEVLAKYVVLATKVPV
jgi:hypothetical protein